MKNIITVGFIVLALFKTVFAQDFSFNYNYLLNPVYVNSALTGQKDKLEMNLNSRYMLTSIEGSPRNIAFVAHSRIKENHGVGAKIISDNRGVFNTTRADAIYAQKFSLNDNMNLRFGFSVGVLRREINPANLDGINTFFDASDPSIFSNNFNNLKFVVGIGALYTWKKLKIGLASPQLIESANDLSEHLFTSASYQLDIPNSKISLEPIVYFQNYKNSPNLVDVLLSTNWDKKANILLGYSNNNRIKSGLGINLKTIGVNYLYEHSTGSLKSLSRSTHEIMLTFSIVSNLADNERTEKELDKLLDYISEVLKDDKVKTREELRKEINNIQKQLDEILKNNKDENSEEVAEKLKLMEIQIDSLINKYNAKIK